MANAGRRDWTTALRVSRVKALSEGVKRLPGIGRILYKIYLILRYGENRVIAIQSGYLAGTRVRRFIRTLCPEYVRGDYEQPVQDAIVRELPSGGVFFDVGGHGGFFALLGSRVVGESGVVVTWEPHPENARQIKAQLRVNAISNAHVVQAAVADCTGMTHLCDDAAADMLMLVSLRNREPPGHSICVKATTLDHETNRWGVPHLIKMDIEGAEARRFATLSRSCADHRTS